MALKMPPKQKDAPPPAERIVASFKATRRLFKRNQFRR